MKVAFLVNDLQLSGGMGVILKHAHHLSELDGWDVTLIVVREQEGPHWHGYEHLPHLHLRDRADAMEEHFDVVIATWWETAFTLFEIPASRYAYFVQSLEDRFYRHEQAERLGALLTLDLPVAFITEARWIQDLLRRLRPEASCHLVRNGIDKALFTPAAQVDVNSSEPLRVLIEGSPFAWFKHVREATVAAAAMREPHRTTIVTHDREALADAPADEIVGPLTHPQMADLYRRNDVLLKLSSVEGMFGPPLEGFHCGATCVVTPVTGHEEYVEHGWNGLLTDWEDLEGTARQLDLLARDRQMLQFLRTNALATARAWPSWEQSSQFMAGALSEILAAPAPRAFAGAARLMGDLRSGLEAYRDRTDGARRALRIEHALRRLLGAPPVRLLLASRRYKLVRLAIRPLRPLKRRARRALT